MLALLVANFGTTTAEFSGVAAAFSLAHVPAWAAVPPVAFGVWLLVTRGSYRKVERVFLALTAVYVAYFVAGFLAKPDWGAPSTAPFVPQVQTNSLWILTAIAAVGTTITPWGQFFIQAYIVDKRISIARYVYTKVEVYLGARVHRRHRPVHRPRLRGDALQGGHRRRDGPGRRQGARAARRAGGRRSSSASGC